MKKSTNHCVGHKDSWYLYYNQLFKEHTNQRLVSKEKVKKNTMKINYK